MTQRITVLLVVTFLSACGNRAQPPETPSATTQAEPESSTEDDYVVGPFVTFHDSSQTGVVTYYIVRN